MHPTTPSTYKDAGVDIDAATDAMGRIRSHVQSTFTEGVLQNLGGFGGLFALGGLKFEDPVLVASVDGVGTKLRVALLAGKHDTVGIDIVSHCVNDILVQGAHPLFFLDYLATGRLDPAVVEAVVAGVAEGCRRAGCALIGGETAEMPGFYGDQDYDLAGTIVGIVERDRIVTGAAIQQGDVIVALGSTGLHTNGYSLARHIFFEQAGLSVDATVDGLDGTVGEALLQPHRCYAPSVLPLLEQYDVRGMAHITGGAMTDNIPRILPPGVDALIRLDSFSPPPIFQVIQRLGSVPDDDMRRTFNLGVGYVCIVPAEQADHVRAALDAAGETAWILGEIVTGAGVVRYG